MIYVLDGLSHNCRAIVSSYENLPGEPRGMPEAGFSEEAGSKAVLARECDIEPLQAGRNVHATNPQVDCLLTMKSSSSLVAQRMPAGATIQPSWFSRTLGLASRSTETRETDARFGIAANLSSVASSGRPPTGVATVDHRGVILFTFFGPVNKRRSSAVST